MSDRVFVIARTFWPVEGGYHYVGRSVNCSKALQDAGAVRGKSTVFFECLTDGNKTKVTQFLAADPRGFKSDVLLLLSTEGFFRFAILHFWSTR